MTAARPPIQGLASYGVTMLPMAFAGIPLYILTPDLYTRHLGVSVAVMGLCLLILRLLDGVQDPLIGWLSDRFARHRARIVAAGFGCMGVGLGLLYLGPFVLSPLVAFVGGVFLATFGFSCLSINLNVAGSFWHGDDANRARVAATREAVTLIGVVLAVTIPIAVIQDDALQTGMALYAMLFFVLLGIGWIGFRRFWRLFQDAHPNPARGAVRVRALGSLVRSPYRGYFVLIILTHLAASFPATLFLFFVNDYLKPGMHAGILLVLYFLSAALLTPLWGMMVRRVGAINAWAGGMALAIVTFMGAAFLQSGDGMGFAVICVLSGLALGSDLVIPPLLLARLIDQRADHANAAQFFSMLALVPKFTMGLVGGCALWVLGQAGFQPGAPEIPADALALLVVLYAVLPCIIKAVSLGFLLFIIHRKGSLVHETVQRSDHHGSVILP